MDGRNRAHVRPGQQVEVVLKQDQQRGQGTVGVVARLLTRSAFHPHGIKVQLEDGRVGRVRRVLAPAGDRPPAPADGRT